jgi:hypothetical protein
MSRYRGDEGLSGYFKALRLVESEEILNLAGSDPAPAAYLSLVGTEERPTSSRFADFSTHWALALVLPSLPDPFTPQGLSRGRIVGRFKSLTYGENFGVLEDEDGTLLTTGVVQWDRIDAAAPDASNSALRTFVRFQLLSNLQAQTREVG